MQVFYDKDDEAWEQYNAEQAKLKKQQTQASRKRRRRASSCSTSSGAAITAGRATPAATAPPSGATDDDPDEKSDTGDDAALLAEGDAAVVLGPDAIAIIKQGLAVVCPRLPNGRFMKRTDFEWPTGWAAVLRGFVQRVKALPRYASFKDESVHKAIAKQAHQ